MLSYMKKEPVLIIAGILAVVSAFFVPPDITYITYIDFRTLGILFSLMVVMAGFETMGIFRIFAVQILQIVRNRRQLLLVLTLLCFFSSMLITNDVALITFVPLTLVVLQMLGKSYKEKWMIPIVAMQTVAANLGSMLTPIGNPQNLYLYGQAGIGVKEFLLLMLPYTAVSFFMIALWCMVKGRKTSGQASRIQLHSLQEQCIAVEKNGRKPKLIIYAFLMLLCLLSVANLLPYGILCGIVILAAVFTDRKILAHIDYSLLLTFVVLFIFIGNMGRIEFFSSYLNNVLEGHEVIAAVLASQVMSNVPAALLLSGFSPCYKSLIIGTDLGGLGTLIASMASLISFKYIAREDSNSKGKYILYFSIINVIFLVVLLGVYMLNIMVI